MMTTRKLLVLCCVLFSWLPSVQAESDGPAILRAKPVSETPQDNKLKKLLKKRFNEALAEAKLTYKLHMQNVKGAYSPMDAGKRLQRAAVELWGRGKETSSFLTDMLEYADFLEKDTQAKLEGNLPKSAMQVLQLDLHKFRQFRLDIEIQKLKLEQGLK